MSDEDRHQLLAALNDVIFIRTPVPPREREQQLARQLLKTRWRHLMSVQDRMDALMRLLPDAMQAAHQGSDRDQAAGHEFYVSVVVDSLLHDGTVERAVTALLRQGDAAVAATPGVSCTDETLAAALQQVFLGGSDDGLSPLSLPCTSMIIVGVLRNAVTRWTAVCVNALQQRTAPPPCRALCDLVLRFQRVLLSQLQAAASDSKLFSVVLAAEYTAFVVDNVLLLGQPLTAWLAEQGGDAVAVHIVPAMLETLPLRLLPELAVALAELVPRNPQLARALLKWTASPLSKATQLFDGLAVACPGMRMALQLREPLSVASADAAKCFLPMADMARTVAALVPTCLRICLHNTRASLQLRTVGDTAAASALRNPLFRQGRRAPGAVCPGSLEVLLASAASDAESQPLCVLLAERAAAVGNFLPLPHSHPGWLAVAMVLVTSLELSGGNQVLADLADPTATTEYLNDVQQSANLLKTALSFQPRFLRLRQGALGEVAG